MKEMGAYLIKLSCSNGIVTLAFQIQDPKLMSQVKAFLDRTLDNQGEDGWLGPEPYVVNATVPRLVWPRYLLLFGLIVHGIHYFSFFRCRQLIVSSAIC